MLFGCSAFLASALITYNLSVWPFFVWTDTWIMKSFLVATGFALGPAFIFGAIAARKGGLAGGCGFIAAMMAFAVFIYLRIDQALMGKFVREFPTPELPEGFKWQVPLVAVIAATLWTLINLPKDQLPG